MRTAKTYFILLAALPFFMAGATFAQDTPPASPEPPSIADITAEKLTALQGALDLTEEQTASLSVLFVNSLTQQREVMEQMRGIHESVKTGVDTILTDEQKEILAKNRRLRGAVSLAPPPQGPRGSRGGPEGFRGERPRGREDFRGERPRDREDFRGERPRDREDFRGEPNRARDGFRRLAMALDVTEEQHAEIRRLITEDKAAMRNALDQVLTEEQKAKLEDIRETLPPPHMAGPRGRRGPEEGQQGMRGPRGGIERLTKDLELTEDQRAEIRRLVTEGDVRPPEALDRVLTDEQKARLEELRAERPGRERRREGRERGPATEPPMEF